MWFAAAYFSVMFLYNARLRLAMVRGKKTIGSKALKAGTQADPENREVVLTFCAHNDDQILGAGGTLAKYAQEGKIFKSYIFSFGESSHPWLKQKVTARMRIKEAQRSERVLGGNDIYFFGIKERNFTEEIEKRNFKKHLAKIIRQNRPVKIFTHSKDDPHPDHRVVFKIIMEVVDEIGYKGDVYTFNVWNPISITTRKNPKMIVDISSTFKKKLEAFSIHKSQKITAFTLLWDIYRRDWLNGLLNRCSYAEVFCKMR